MRRQAATDDLTGLPNRRALLLRIGQHLRTGRPAALLLLDLDGFKAVNDGLGHHVGDQLLQELGERIRPALRPTDVLARLGGEIRRPAPGCRTRGRPRLRPADPRPGLPPGDARRGAGAGRREHRRRQRTRPGARRPRSPPVGRRGDVRGEVRPRRRPGLHTRPRRTRPVPARPGRPRTSAPRSASGRSRWSTRGSWASRPSSARPRTVLPALPEVLDAAAGWASAAVPVWIVLPAAELGPGRLPDQLCAALLRSGVPAEAVVVRLRRSAGRPADDVPPALAALRARGIRTAVDVSARPAGTARPARPARRLDPPRPGPDPRDPRRPAARPRRRAHRRPRPGLGLAVLADGADGPTAAWLTQRGCEVVAGESAALTAGQLTEWLRRVDDAGVPD